MICGLYYYSLVKLDDVIEFCSSGVCYAVKVPLNAEFPASGGTTPSYVYIYHHITEQSQALFGFPNRDDLNLFKTLITVDGIGPASALKIMSFYPSEKIRIDIADGDADDLCKAKGVGKKSADRIIATLKEK